MAHQLTRRLATRTGAACLLIATAVAGCGEHQGPGAVTDVAIPSAAVNARKARQDAARAGLGAPPGLGKQILFGDLHVHTTFSADAFALALPLLGGEGLHPPADACDFARFCADLDFWSINDHAEGLTPQHWRETVDSLRQCNAPVTADGEPDTVAFLGWEWTQVGNTPENHYGHKNVVLREIGEGRVPARPIHAIRPDFTQMKLPLLARLAPLTDLENRQVYWDQQRQTSEVAETPACPAARDTKDLPEECMEGVETPSELYAKLDQWGFDSLVIPHGTTWGFNAPGGASLDLGLTPTEHDPDRQRLFEIYSGHGNTEEYRSWRTRTIDAEGELVCPAPTDDYLACCWQAGEIIRARCNASGSIDDCDERAATARQHYLAAGPAGHQTVPGVTARDWLDCGQCRDCFLAANNHLPRMSGQYALASTNLSDPSAPLEYRMGFIGSSDPHRARAGNGFKEFGLRRNADATLSPGAFLSSGDPVPESREIVLDELPIQRRRDTERQASLYVTGGLVGVHAAARQRDSIFAALENREVYATSGERILLWFDLLNAPDGPAPMGSEVAMATTPRFRVAAVGAFAQSPGCPDYAQRALGAERLDRLCLNECYNPSDERKPLSRIEVVRIRPQRAASEKIADLVEDPWKTFACEGGPSGCAIEFDDPDYPELGRSVAYYVRAIQTPTPAVNGEGLGCRYDSEGRCIAVRACGVDAGEGEACLADVEERAWSSPIWIDPPRRKGSEPARSP